MPARRGNKRRVHKDCSSKPMQRSCKRFVRHSSNSRWGKGSQCGTNLKCFRHWKNNRYSPWKATRQQSRIKQIFSWENLLGQGKWVTRINFVKVAPISYCRRDTLPRGSRKANANKKNRNVFRKTLAHNPKKR